MNAKNVTPILNVSDMQKSFDWFEKLGWRKSWDWGNPPDFGSVCAGEYEIFLCLNGQGGRGNDNGSWMALLVDDVDAIHERCLEQGIEVAWPPTDRPWGLREMWIADPDGTRIVLVEVPEDHPLRRDTRSP